jgi:hypothetical protein
LPTLKLVVTVKDEKAASALQKTVAGATSGMLPIITADIFSMTMRADVRACADARR